MDEAVAVALFLAVTAYAVLAGADLGAGFWDLVAGGADRGARPRALIDHAIGPVWEANHVWLIFALVVLWTAFPEAFASITLTLFVPLTLVALGIVLRGAGFAFRKSLVRTSERRAFGALFATSSVLVPYGMGAVAGAIASGRVPAGGEAGDPVTSWVNPTSVVGGVLAVAAGAYLAAVYLVWDARRLADDAAVEYFRRRAVGAAVAAGATACAGVVVLRADARYVFDGMAARALPLVALSALGGLGSLALLVRGAAGSRAPRGARLLAVGAVASIVWGWGVAQWPYLLPTDLRVSEAAAPSATLATVLVVFGVAAVVIGPALALLYALDQRSLLPDEPDAPGAPGGPAAGPPGRRRPPARAAPGR
ncbi:MAG TPA: cytochrome d ubiquinol oxidase subunit II [Acidimicrobiales bacterium]